MNGIEPLERRNIDRSLAVERVEMLFDRASIRPDRVEEIQAGRACDVHVTMAASTVMWSDVLMISSHWTIEPWRAFITNSLPRWREPINTRSLFRLKAMADFRLGPGTCQVAANLCVRKPVTPISSNCRLDVNSPLLVRDNISQAFHRLDNIRAELPGNFQVMNRNRFEASFANWRCS
jgi:hypothetical protein